jgi:hypothetical protein
MDSGPGLDWGNDSDVDFVDKATVTPATYGGDVGALAQLDDMAESVAVAVDFL